MNYDYLADVGINIRYRRSGGFSLELNLNKFPISL